jgi:hypothetical protein
LPTYSNPGPPEVIAYFKTGVHTGRGTGLDKAISAGVLSAVAAHPRIAPHRDRIAYSLFMTLGTAVRNVDLVIGSAPPYGTLDLLTGFVAAAPTDVWFAGEWKSVMTEHGKAARNRRGDFEAHAGGLWSISGKAVTAGLAVINAADRYFSYTAKGVRSHGDGNMRAQRTYLEVEGVGSRADTSRPGLDVLALPVVVVDNVNLDAAHYLEQKPQAPDGDQRSWGVFIQRTGDLLYDRFIR